ncbi:MAG: class I SAM-dependent methyltransferase [Verrucomicrobiota bacterium]
MPEGRGAPTVDGNAERVAIDHLSLTDIFAAVPGLRQRPDADVLAFVEDGPLRGEILDLEADRLVASFPIPDLSVPDPIALVIAPDGNEVFRGWARRASAISYRTGSTIEFELLSESARSPGSPDKAVEGQCEAFFEKNRAAERLDSSFCSLVAKLDHRLNQFRKSLTPVLDASQPGDLRDLASQVLQRTRPYWDSIFSEFEAAAARVPPGQRTAHLLHAREQLQAHLLPSPFLRRAREKPLEVPGDHVILSHLLGERFQGSCLYSMVMNGWLISTPAGDAYRHRIHQLTLTLTQAIGLCRREKRPARILSLGCGAACEIQTLFQQQPDLEGHFILVDGSRETLQHTTRVLNELRKKAPGLTFETHLLEVREFLRLTRAGAPVFQATSFDLVYCAGLFDYLPRRLASKLIEGFDRLTRTGGTVVMSNFTPDNPVRFFMEAILDWNLIHRTGEEFADLIPARSGLLHKCETSFSPQGVEAYLHLLKG